jgi:cytosine/uracil/thiamine/allantoin permease
MSQIIKYIIAAVLCFVVFKLITLPGIVGTIDTTGTAPTWLTIIAAVVALALFGWCVSKINKNG